VIIAIAAIGFLFDTYELLMLPLIVRPALADLHAAPVDSAAFNTWVGIIFYAPAVAGGLFGLLGGYLTDVFGRRRVLVWSILLYGVSACGAAFATSVWTLLLFRCGTFVGVCVEFVAAVAWLAELYADPAERERVIGWTQACASLGGLLVSGVYYGVVSIADSLPAIHGAHEPWRYMLISGLFPALPLIVVRPFLPESPLWQRPSAGMRSRARSGLILEIFGPKLRTVTIVTAVMMTACYAASFGANLQVPRIVPSLPEVQAMTRVAREQTVGLVQSLQELGGLAGRIALAFLAVRVVSRRALVRAFIGPGLVIMPFVFFIASKAESGSLWLIEAGTFLAGFVTVAQFSFWGNYLPRMYPTRLRGTGESFAANIGGRMLGTGGAMVTAQLTSVMPGGLAAAAGTVGVVSFVVALAASVWLPEPQSDGLPD
jgi:MFS family permease